MVKLVNRAKMTTATTGIGTITLGSASTGYQSFAAAGVSDGDIVRYVIEDGDNWEIGAGTYTASGTTLTRTVSESSNADAAITLTGSAVVFVTVVAADVDDVVLGTVTSGNVDLSTGTYFQYSPVTGESLSFSNYSAPTKFTLEVTGSGLENFAPLGVTASTTLGDKKGMTFKPDGLSLFVMRGGTQRRVQSYNLTTPFDVTTLSSPIANFSVSSQDFDPRGVAFSSDGTRMYIAGLRTSRIYQYTLSTPWDITSATVGSNYFISGYDDIYGFWFSPDGTFYFTAAEGTNSVPILTKYAMSTAWDITSSSVSETLGLSSNRWCKSIVLSSDGSTLIFGYSNTAAGDGNSLSLYSLPTSFSLSGATESVTYTGASNEVSGIAFNGDEDVLIVAKGGSATSDDLSEYGLPGTAFPLVYSDTILFADGMAPPATANLKTAVLEFVSLDGASWLGYQLSNNME